MVCVKLLHLSDLHIGKRVNECSMLEDQRYILEQIAQLAIERKVDGVLLAGDLYDKPVPPAEAVILLDTFFTALSQAGIPVFAISGNHDSPERLSFGARLLTGTGIYLSAVYQGPQEPVLLRDAYGEVAIYLLPYLKPALVRHSAPEAEIATYQDAVSYALQQWTVPPSRRNVLVAHQFVTGGTTSESEEHSVGGLDQVSGELFDPFDYVALGHLHRAQSVGRPTLRYCGTPLKYSFSESGQEKSVTLVTLEEKGRVKIEAIPLCPMRDLREVRGTYETVTSRKFYQGMQVEDYLHVILTDEEDVPEAMGKLRTIYPNLLKLSYDNLRTQSTGEILGAERPEEKTPLALFQDLYQLQNNQTMHQVQEEFLKAEMEKIWEESLCGPLS